MSKKSDAKRKAKLKDRYKRAEFLQSRITAAPDVQYEWKGPSGDEPQVLAELHSDEGDLIAYIEGYGDDDNWEFVVDYQQVAVSSDEFVVLSWFLHKAAAYVAQGAAATMAFSPWMIEKMEARCVAASIEWSDLLRSLLPTELQHIQLPQQRTM